MSLNTNKTVIRNWYEKAWNERNIALADELIDANFVAHDYPGQPTGVAAAKNLVNQYLTAFPDIHFTIEDIIAEEDKVMARWTARGTHKGDLMGAAPTNKQMIVKGVTISRIANGKIVEFWDNFDQLGMLKQLDLVSLS
ncbi:ester cyclase [Nostocaceae cyanobacterium CENA357]|uniref:Ester cyclase n=1 Tax=Atlanticothrix silvestris CENA357 TaxID=1725252 RepID=A0A8J7HIF5_9CYAN|nr:ester cyclase [Atlanticothrix silvestris]MBH8556133.1 ester cyclase [Atlanticothrix silvestris CENA357]